VCHALMFINHFVGTRSEYSVCICSTPVRGNLFWQPLSA